MSNQIFANKDKFYPFIDSTASVLTDKGGLLSSDGNNIVQVPGNILDNLILTTDASQTSGLKWETQSTFNNLGQAINLANQTTNSTVFVNALSTNLILAGGSYIINFSCDIFHDTVGNVVVVRFVDNASDVGKSISKAISDGIKGGSAGIGQALVVLFGSLSVDSNKELIDKEIEENSNEIYWETQVLRNKE